MSKLKSDSELKTTRFRQAVCIIFASRNHIPDPCRNKQGYKRITACLIKQLMTDHNSHSETVRGYVDAINIQFCLWNFDVQADLTDRSNMCYKIILAWEREENIAWQRSPVYCLAQSIKWGNCWLTQNSCRRLVHTNLYHRFALCWVHANTPISYWWTQIPSREVCR